jgi:hypothetical protein
MDVPSTRDRAVKVTAYLTDETFGYTHWRAAQFCPPEAETHRPAVLVICTSVADRELVLAALAALTP